MKIKIFVCNPFQVNTYLLYDETGEAVFIDSGFFDETEFQEACLFVERENLKPVALVNTHLHLDHCCGNSFVEKAWNLKAKVGGPDLFLGENLAEQARMFRLPYSGNFNLPESFLKENDIISFGNTELKVLESPGHSPGSLSFYDSKSEILFSGDVLLYQGVGRTDLPGGSYEILDNTIRNKLFLLPSNTTVFCGHGPKTTIGTEKENYSLW